MATQYRVEHLPNGLYRVFDQRTRAVTVLNANGTFRHGFPMAPIHIHDALKQAGFDVVPLSKMQIPTASFVPLRDDLLKIGKSGLKKGAKGILGGVAGLGAEILMPTDLGAADIEDPKYMSPDDPRRIRAERNVAGAEFLAEQPGFGTTAPWAGQEPRPRDPSAYENQETGMEIQDFNLPRDIADQLAPPVTEYPEEEQLMAAAEELDATKEEAFASMAPIGDFSKDALNSLVDALNKALPLFGAPEDYATFAEDIEGALPTEFVRYLAMTSQAANDANLGRLAVDLENIGTDSDLMKAAGQLDVLAENDSFRTFMASADKDTAPPVAEEVVEKEVQVRAPISDTEVEAMFVQRAR